MKNPVRRVIRIARRSLKGRGNGRSIGKGERRRLHGRGIPAALASLTGPQYEEMCQTLAETAGIHQAKVMDDEVNQRIPPVKPWSATCVPAHNIIAANAPKVMAQTDSDIQHDD
eukprot:6654371-Pyramimonas_sp.AAC.1